MTVCKVKESEREVCLKMAEEITASSIGSYLSKDGADSVSRWLRSSASSCTWFSCGRGVCAYDEKESRIVFIGVIEEERRKGYGTQLLEAVRDLAEENHCARITANALQDAIGFYEASGFDLLAPVTEGGGLKYAPVEYLLGRRLLGKTVKVIVDRPYGSLHPHIADLEYELNFGFVSGNEAEDAEMQDAWIYGIHEPMDTFTGTVIGIVYHKDGASRLITAPAGMVFTKEDVIEAIGFEEQYYETRIIWVNSLN